MSSSEARQRLTTSVLIAVGFGLLYAATLYPGVGGVLNHGDSAKFQFLGFVPGVGHPPGNPLYLALLTLVQRVPLGSPALRANLASALCAAVALGLLANATYRMAGRRGSLVAASVLGLGGLFWEFATEAEVYMLNGALVAFIAYALVRAETERNSRMLAAAVAAFLIGVAGHLSLVVALPGLLLAAFSLARRGLRPRSSDVLLVVCALVISLGLYALLPVWHAHAVYSEYGGAPGLSGFIDFVTGAKWRSGLKWPSLEEALAGRTLTVLTVLLRQWMLPLWLCMPLAFYFFLPRFPATAGFCLAASLAFVGFVYVYDIPDPDGLVIALACCLAPSMGVAVQALRHSRWAAACVLCAVAPTAALHVTTFRDAVGYDVLEDVVGNKDREALDMPDIVQRLPDGAYFMLPCTHYGCVQVMNYYRFADAAVSERKIQIAQLLGGRLSRWHSSPPVVAPKLARSAVVCTVHERERALLASVGTVMRKIERGELRVGSRVYPRIPLYCSEPSG